MDEAKDIPFTLEKEQETTVEPVVEEKTTEAKEAKEAEWDKQRQQLDQERANAEKARNEALAARTETNNIREKLESIETKLADKEKTITDEKNRLDNLDPDLVDKSVIRNIETLNRQLQEVRAEVATHKDKVRVYEQKEAQQEQVRVHTQAVEEVLGACDDEFGAKYRNEAKVLADSLVDSGKERQPTSQFAGYRLMKKCYAEVVKKHVPKEKPKPPTSDSGLGGLSPANIDTVKTGSMSEVLADMKKDDGWKHR